MSGRKEERKEERKEGRKEGRLVDSIDESIAGSPFSVLISCHNLLCPVISCYVLLFLVIFSYFILSYFIIFQTPTAHILLSDEQLFCVSSIIIVPCYLFIVFSFIVHTLCFIFFLLHFILYSVYFILHISVRTVHTTYFILNVLCSFFICIYVFSLLPSHILGYLYERLDGNTRASDRNDSVKRFGNPAFNRFIMLLSTKAGKGKK